VVHWVKQHRPGTSKEEIVDVLQSLKEKDFYRMSRADDRTHYYCPIFTPYPGGYQMDLLQQSNTQEGQEYPKYWYLFVNINTRYGYAYPIDDKKAGTIIGVLEKWVKEVNGKVVSLVADEESAWNSNAAENWLKDHGIKLKMIDNQRHSALGIIDRFIRTLRDMNVRTEKSKYSSEARKYRDFTPKRMYKLLHIYNTSLHKGIGMTPEEMDKDMKKQKEYIIKKLYETERRKKISDFQLKVDSWVRYMIPREMGKRRYQVSPDVYKIDGKEGNGYRLVAADGTMRTFSRWRLFPVEDISGYKIGKSFNNNTGRILRVLSGPDKYHKYKVEWKTAEGKVITDELKKNILTQTNGRQLLEEYHREKRSSK
jgi:hypothetical protein